VEEEFDPFEVVQAVLAGCRRADDCPIESVTELLTAKAQEQQNLVDQLRLTFVRLLQRQEEERARISKELHDNVAQLLSAAKMGLGKDQGPVRHILDQAIAAVWRVGTELRPYLLDLVGLGAALEDLVRKTKEQTGLECSVTVTCEPDIGADKRLALYRMCEEAVANVRRHAQATRLGVELSQEGPDLRLVITDDGKGFKPAEIPKGAFGLLGIRDTLRVFGGTLEIYELKPTGTRLVLSLPASEASGEASQA